MFHCASDYHGLHYMVTCFFASAFKSTLLSGLFSKHIGWVIKQVSLSLLLHCVSILLAGLLFSIACLELSFHCESLMEGSCLLTSVSSQSAHARSHCFLCSLCGLNLPLTNFPLYWMSYRGCFKFCNTSEVLCYCYQFSTSTGITGIGYQVQQLPVFLHSFSPFLSFFLMNVIREGVVWVVP